MTEQLEKRTVNKYLRNLRQQTYITYYFGKEKHNVKQHCNRQGANCLHFVYVLFSNLKMNLGNLRNALCVCEASFSFSEF